MTDSQNGPNVLHLTTHVGSKEDECTHVMMIENIVSKIVSAKPGDSIQSGTLECGNMKIKLIIYPNGKSTKSEGSLAVFIGFDNRGKMNWKSIEILAAENINGDFLKVSTVALGDLLKKEKSLPRRSKYLNGALLKSFLPHNLILAETNSPFFPKGVITLKVNIKVEGEETVTYKTAKYPSIPGAQLKEELSEHFRKMFDSHQFADFKIICQGESIPCHCSVLAARSEVFEAMFNNNMKENKTGEVEINDFDFRTLKAAVIYIYTGEVADTEWNDEAAEQLLRAADKYQLGGLKNMMEAILIQAVKIENAIDMFVLGDAVRAGNLRDVSKETIVRNAAAIVEIDGWKEALGRFHELTLEMFESVAKSRTQTK